MNVKLGVAENPMLQVRPRVVKRGSSLKLWDVKKFSQMLKFAKNKK